MTRAVLAGVALVLVGAGAAALLARRGDAPDPREQVRGHAFAIPSYDRRVTVEVLNATARPGLARAATRALRQEGLDVVSFGSSEQRLAETVVLIRRGADSGAARRAVGALGAGRIAVEIDTLRRVDLSVLVGGDWRGGGTPANR